MSEAGDPGIKPPEFVEGSLDASPWLASLTPNRIARGIEEAIEETEEQGLNRMEALITLFKLRWLRFGTSEPLPVEARERAGLFRRYLTESLPALPAEELQMTGAFNAVVRRFGVEKYLRTQDGRTVQLEVLERKQALAFFVVKVDGDVFTECRVQFQSAIEPDLVFTVSSEDLAMLFAADSRSGFVYLMKILYRLSRIRARRKRGERFKPDWTGMARTAGGAMRGEDPESPTDSSPTDDESDGSGTESDLRDSDSTSLPNTE